MTEALEKRFAEVGDQDIPDPIVIAHYFFPLGVAEWFATAYYPEADLFYGWAEIIPGGGEWGYFLIHDLELIKGLFGASVERDLNWVERRASEIERISKK
jgi:hypothetical protein